MNQPTRTSMKLVVLTGLFTVLAAAQCPIEITRFGINMNQLLINHSTAFDLRYTNKTSKVITGMKFRGVWIDAVDDVHTVLSAFTEADRVKAGATKTVGWKEPFGVPEDRKGWFIAPIKVLYDDGSTWQMTEADRGCFGQMWMVKHDHWKEAPKQLFE